MKKAILFAVCAVLALTGCNSGQKKMNPADIQNDSLRSVIEARDNEINDMMGTLNDIQQGFDEINAAENRVSVAKDGEGVDKRIVSSLRNFRISFVRLASRVTRCARLLRTFKLSSSRRMVN